MLKAICLLSHNLLSLDKGGGALSSLYLICQTLDSARKALLPLRSRWGWKGGRGNRAEGGVENGVGMQNETFLDKK